MSEFQSVFAPLLDAMLENHTARGYKRKTYLHHLLRFDQYCCDMSCETPELTAELVHGGLETESSLCNLAGRAMAIRQFGKYLCAVKMEAYILPDKFSPSKHPKPPYIFTDDELSALFAKIDRLEPNKSEPYLTEILPVLFRLTYTCGLRPNESRELLWKNVNLDNGEILITETKHRKERIVVMSDDMLAMCRQYDLKRGIFGGGNPFFFPSYAGGALTNTAVYAAFNKAWKSAGYANTNIRVYDLRHRFASARLNRWLDSGENLMAMLPYLRAYMGHDRMEDTAYYIHILPENLAKTSAIDWESFNAMFPEATP